MSRMTLLAGLVVVVGMTMGVRAGEVSGRVEMPAFCAPAVSPAVVVLEPQGGAPAAGASRAEAGAVSLIRQSGLQFVPRVGAMTVGQTLRFTNEDTETHGVHLLMERVTFNERVNPGAEASFVPKAPGVVRVVCDVHSHMRAFVVVAASPWVAVCDPAGKFRIRDVPDGTYSLKVWHEMGEGLLPERELTVQNGRDVVLPPLAVGGGAGPGRVLRAAPFRKWPEVIDRIGMLLTESLLTAPRPDGLPRARRLAEDSYWVEFEASGMEVAVRNHLGYERTGELEEQFRGFIKLFRDPAGKAPSSAKGTEATRRLLLGLSRTAEDLNRLGIVDGSHATSAALSSLASPAPDEGDYREQLRALGRSFDGVLALAGRGEADAASSALTDAYFNEFEPLERVLAVRAPGSVVPLEARFNSLRGQIGGGLKGPELAKQLAGLRAEVEADLARVAGIASGSLGAALGLSLVIILREGVEVILLLTMLVALATKAGHRRAMAAIRWGIGLAVAASLATALGLNLLVASTQGRAREMLEGGVMLAAAAVLFYVSYWLISQVESKRWTDFLKWYARQGTELGGYGTLGLTAFLAIYREGAETALMYQGLIADQRGSHGGLLGVGLGLAIGLVLLAGIYVAIRSASVRLPLRPFFQVTGGLLFALAVIFAGKGVFEWQTAGLIKVTPLPWLGHGLPLVGLFPNVQAVAVQGLLLAGAVLAMVVVAFDRPSRRPVVQGSAASAPAGEVSIQAGEMTRA